MAHTYRNSRLWQFSVALAALASLTIDVTVQAAAPIEKVDFARDVAPILQRHCTGCHQRGVRKGELSLESFADLRANEFVIPGKPEESRLIDVVTRPSADKPPEMPKGGPPLTDLQIDVLRRWIKSGADWPDEIVLRDQMKADESWWSLQPLAGVAPPSADGVPPEWQANPIDRFVFRRLAEQGLLPNGPADRRTLIRRLSYDLTGLPPSVADVQSFVSDTSPDAYEKLVARLLESPRYGEQWGRHWLDVARFGESNGYERNVLINNAWPYRDYVIRSFNEDKPFDRLVLEHLAGDVIGSEEPDAAIGTAFLVCGPHDNVGNQDAVQAAVIRANHVDEIIRTTSEAFLGLTVGCARCHDHKFDPVTQNDYYAWHATFFGVRHDARPIAKQSEPAVGNLPALPPTVFAGKFEEIAGRRFQSHRGGDPQQLGEEVAASSLSVFGKLTSSYRLPDTATEAERRLALARWIVALDNPLTPRVLANRIWQHHFGTGIVDTPSDFGYLGGRPAHPELLDWLAHQIHANGWRLKPIHRLIVTSQAYRQASTWRKEAAEVDGDSRLVWRNPPRRLTGEELRDTMLVLADKLARNESGGPGFRLYKYIEDNVATYVPLDEHGPETYRRAVYHQNARAAQVDVLSQFDCPDPAIAVPRRNSTTTPLQALALINHRFTFDMAQFFAQRIDEEIKTKELSENERRRAQITWAFEEAFGRPPGDEEISAARQLIERHGLAAFCRALMNGNELVFIQ